MGNKNHLYLTSDEKRLLVLSLLEFRNELIEQGKYTDCVDELLIKLKNAPVKKIKIKEG